MAGASRFEYTVTALFTGRHPSPSGTWARWETARERLEMFLDANARTGNPAFLGASLLVSTRASRFGPGLPLVEIEIPPGAEVPEGELDREVQAAVERLRHAGTLRERMVIEHEFPFPVRD